MIVGKSFCTTPYRSSLIEDEIRKDKPAKKIDEDGSCEKSSTLHTKKKTKRN